MIDGRFPLFENDGFLSAEFTVERYRDRTAALGAVGGAVVAGSFQRFDQSCLLDALSRRPFVDRGSARSGIAVLAPGEGGAARPASAPGGCRRSRTSPGPRLWLGPGPVCVTCG